MCVSSTKLYSRVSLHVEIKTRMKFLDCYKILLALSLGCTTLLFLPSLQNFEVDPDPEESQLDILRRERPILSYVKSLSHLRYKDRIDSVREQCSLNRYTPEVQEVNNDTKWNTDLWFDYDNQLLFCQISKISSSTWVKHLMR